MDNLKNLIKGYLNHDTKYAFMITGDWGIGKTHYYKSVIEKFISSTPIQKNETINYKPIYVSLYGKKSIKEVTDQIVLNFYTSKYFPVTSKYFRKRRLLNSSIFFVCLLGNKTHKILNSLQKVKSYFLEKSDEHLIDISELCLCFDDLERKDKALDLITILGYINHLVDNGIKVITICNSNKIESSELLEKTIGISVPYMPDPTSILTNLINDKYPGSRSFTSYLLEIEHILKQSLEANSNNLRLLEFSLDKAYSLYNTVQLRKASLDSEVKAMFENRIENLYHLLITLSFEFAGNLVTTSNLKDFKNSFFIVNKELDDKNYLDRFLKKYNIDSQIYKFYLSIFNHALNVKEIDFDELLNEFKGYYFKQGEIKIGYDVFDQLNFKSCYNLTDDDYIKYTKQLINYAHKGVYEIQDYFSVCFLVERHDNICGFDLVEIKDKLFEGLQIAFNTKKYDFDHFEIVGSRAESPVLAPQLLEHGRILAGLDNVEKEKTHKEQMGAYFIEEIDQFIHRYFNTNFKEDVDYIDFISHLKSEEIAIAVVNSNSYTLSYVDRFFTRRTLYDTESIILKSAFQKMIDLASNDLQMSKHKKFVIIEVAKKLIKNYSSI